MKIAMQSHRSSYDDYATTRKGHRRQKTGKARQADDEVEESIYGTQRTMQPSQRLIEAVEENETTTDTEK